MFVGSELQFPVDFIEESKLESEGRSSKKSWIHQQEIQKKNGEDPNEFGLKITLWRWDNLVKCVLVKCLISQLNGRICFYTRNKYI